MEYTVEELEVIEIEYQPLDYQSIIREALHELAVMRGDA